MNKALFSSAKMDWQTPDEVLERVRLFGPIGLDPATAPDNPTGAREFYTPLEDDLAQPWLLGGGEVFCNPPYGREIGKWTAKAREEARRERTERFSITMLVPARPDTKWWHEAAFDAVCFWRGRLTFKGAPHPEPFPSALLYWGRYCGEQCPLMGSGFEATYRLCGQVLFT